MLGVASEGVCGDRGHACTHFAGQQRGEATRFGWQEEDQSKRRVESKPLCSFAG